MQNSMAITTDLNNGLAMLRKDQLVLLALLLLLVCFQLFISFLAFKRRKNPAKVSYLIKLLFGLIGVTFLIGELGFHLSKVIDDMAIERTHGNGVPMNDLWHMFYLQDAATHAVKSYYVTATLLGLVLSLILFALSQKRASSGTS
jgi:hypothetical protein